MLKTNSSVTIEETVVQKNSKPELAKAKNDVDNEYCEVKVENLNFFYGSVQALFNVTIKVKEKRVAALIGPSGCGKSTFLRVLNRMNDLIPGTRLEGRVTIHGENIYTPETDVVNLRKKVGMVFQQPNPFPKSISDNIATVPG